MAIATNVRGQSAAVYAALRRLAGTRGDRGALGRVSQQEDSRVTLVELEASASSIGMRIDRTVSSHETLRFAGVRALLQHHFVRLAFLDGWRSIFPEMNDEELAVALDLSMGDAKEVRLDVPLAYVELVCAG